MMPETSYDCTGALAGVLLRDLTVMGGAACEGGDGSLTVRREAVCRRWCCGGGDGGECGDGLRRCGGELEAGCEALGALLLAPLGAELGDSL